MMDNIKVIIGSHKNIKAVISSGARGKSAYEIWLDLGNEGSEQDFIDSISTGGQGTTNYEQLRNKPSIETIELEGDKTFEELGLVAITEQEIKNLF